jgi:hypothetical protein
MAVGDVVIDLQEVAAGASLEIQPGVGAEWFISNVFFSGAVSIYLTDGALECLTSTYRGAGRWACIVLHITNTVYLKIKNISATTKLIGYDGVVTK